MRAAYGTVPALYMDVGYWCILPLATAVVSKHADTGNQIVSKGE